MTTASLALLVGRYISAGHAEFLPMSREEVSRAALACQSVLATFGIAPGRFLLIVSVTEEAQLFAPLEQAATALGIKLANADASSFEGRRVEAICRQFDVAMVAGINAEVLDSIEQLGHSLATVFSGKIVWARPDAMERLSAIPGVTVMRWLDLGPTAALECVKGNGAHVSAMDWQVTTIGTEIRLSTVLPRLHEFSDFATRVHGRIETAPCACGIAGARLLPSAPRSPS